MANKPVKMLKVKRMLQLLDKGMSQRGICEELQMGRGTLSAYQVRIGCSGLSLQSLLSLPDYELSELLSPKSSKQSENVKKTDFDKRFPGYTWELKRIGVTRMRLWEEYRIEDPDGYSYTQFCEHLSHYIQRQNLSYHNIHQPGDVF